MIPIAQVHAYVLDVPVLRQISPDRWSWRIDLARPASLPLGPSRNSPHCFAVRDHNEQALAYFYFDEEQGRRSAAKLLERDEARRIAGGCVLFSKRKTLMLR